MEGVATSSAERKQRVGLEESESAIRFAYPFSSSAYPVSALKVKIGRTTIPLSEVPKYITQEPQSTPPLEWAAALYCAEALTDFVPCVLQKAGELLRSYLRGGCCIQSWHDPRAREHQRGGHAFDGENDLICFTQGTGVGFDRLQLKVVWMSSK